MQFIQKYFIIKKQHSCQPAYQVKLHSRGVFIMKYYDVNKIRNIALAGHNGSGKTSLAEAILYKAGASDRLGKTADGTTVCDYDPEEIKRGMKLFPLMPN